MTSAFSWQNSISLCPASFRIPRPNLSSFRIPRPIIVLQCYTGFRCKTQWFDILIYYKMIPTSLFPVTIKVIKILTMLPLLCFISMWLIYYVTHPSTLFLSGNHHFVLCFCESVSVLLCLFFCFDFLISCIHRMLKLKLQYFGHLMGRVDSLEKTLMLGGIGCRRRDDRGWDGWMASPTWWTWVWVNSGSWWWTGRPGVLRFMGLQRVGHDWVTELNWTDT